MKNKFLIYPPIPHSLSNQTAIGVGGIISDAIETSFVFHDDCFNIIQERGVIYVGWIMAEPRQNKGSPRVQINLERVYRGWMLWRLVQSTRYGQVPSAECGHQYVGRSREETGN